MKVYLNLILVIVTFGKVEPYPPLTNIESFDDNMLADPGEVINNKPSETMERKIDSTQISEEDKVNKIQLMLI